MRRHAFKTRLDPARTGDERDAMTEQPLPPSSGAALPVRATILDSLRFVLRRLPQLLLYGWPFILLLAGVGTAQDLLRADQAAALPVVLIQAGFAIVWHRYVFFGTGGVYRWPDDMAEQPRPPVKRLAQQFVLLLLLYALIPVIFFLSGVGGYFVLINAGWVPVIVVSLILALILLILLVRFSLVFPGVAYGDEGTGFRKSWGQASGHQIRMLLIYLAILVPLTLVEGTASWLTDVITGRPPRLTPALIGNFTAAVLILTGMAVLITAGSRIYERVVLRRAPLSSTEAAAI